ncbi:hypothetical protein [Micromonospora sp. DT227]|uniref:hypothetical protein n=1 Tax=Micromonospora sp. DT227 TaxID=3393433 RepID=UPI003CF6801E
MTTFIGKNRRVGEQPCRLRLVAIPIGLSLTAVIGACSTDDRGEVSSSASSSTPRRPVATASAASREAAALDAYRGMWQAYAKAGLTANPQEPDLARYTTGPALALLTSGLTKLRAEGEIIKGQYQSSPHVVTATTPSPAGDTVTVQDCLNTTDFLTYKASSGTLANDTPGGNRAVLATVTRDDVIWKVSTVAAQAVGTC